MKKKLVAMVLAAATVMGAAITAHAADYKVLIGSSNQAQSFYAWLAKACEKEIEENYDDVTCDVFDIAGDPANVLTLFENAEIGGYNGIILDAPDETDYTKQMQDLKDEGIYTVRVNRSVEKADGVSTNVGLNHYDLGHYTGEAAAERLPENARVLIIGSVSGNPANEDRKKGFIEALKDNKRDDVTILEQLDCGYWAKEEAMATMEDYTQKYGEDDFDAVYAVCDDMVLGAIEVCDAAGFDTQKLQFYGIDGLAGGCLAIKDGTLTATVLQNCDDEAKTGMEYLYKMMTGEDTGSYSIDLPPTVVTAENVDDIIAIHEANGMMQ